MTNKRMKGINALPKELIIALIVLFCNNVLFSQIIAEIDLSQSHDDYFHLDVQIDTISLDSVHYNFPKILPGFYSEVNLGNYISEFKAFDKEGSELQVIHNDTNSYLIPEAKKIDHLTYLVEDTLDALMPIFDGLGSNIEYDTNYIINPATILGYFLEIPNNTYSIKIRHSKNLYASTSLFDLDASSFSDTFYSNNYQELVDSPLMYNVPDTTWINIGDFKILLSVYSKDKKLNSKFFADKIKSLLDAQIGFMGDVPGVSKYAFIIYLKPEPYKSGFSGAMEHNQSSLYTLIESDTLTLGQRFATIASHEFLHLITPLGLHSEEVQNFDFNAPKMSRHLWLYEGVIEYFSYLVQVKYGFIDYPTFLYKLSKKITDSRERFNDSLSMTEMSLHCLDQYNSQWPNVYLKGALIAVCLDLKLLSLSAGRYGLIDLINSLKTKYGKDKPFKDATFISEIINSTNPEIGSFFKNYVVGNIPIPYEDYLQLVGIKLNKQNTLKVQKAVTSVQSNLRKSWIGY